MCSKRIVGLAIAVMLVGLVGLVSVATAGDIPTRFGADLRLREEAFDHFPVPPQGQYDYFRVRPRVWGEADLLPNVTFRARAVDEFRIWDVPTTDKRQRRGTYEFPDEIVFDNLYLDLRDLLDKQLDLRVGRQEMIYGTGKVILEGTPEDGSRTIYFNAVKAVWKGIQDTTVDVFGIYDPAVDPIAVHTAHRDLTGYTGANDDMTESGAGVYLKNKAIKALPFEAYGIYKNESEWDQAATKDPKSATGFKAPKLAWQTLDKASGKINNDALDLGTLGFRLMPKFTPDLSGNLEAAYQFGDRGGEKVTGWMTDAFATYAIPGCPWKSAVDAGVYYLSGDDPKTSKDEGWDPLWARYPQYSELYVYLYPRGRWSNLMMPHAGVSMSPTAWLKTSAMVAYLNAPEKDGPGTGDERGWLEVVKGEFTIAQGLLAKGERKDKLSGHVWLEVLQPGDYYTEDTTAYFARWQLMYEF